MNDSNDTPPDRFNESPPLAAYVQDASSLPAAPAQNAYGIKTDSRTANSILLQFVEVMAETPKAICLKVLDHDTEQLIEDWFPKKLCSNMNTVKNEVHVWDVFMEQHKADLIPPKQRVKGGSNE